jgi:predicted transcriptional regulator
MSISYTFDRTQFGAADFQVATFLNHYQERSRKKSTSSNYDTLREELERYLKDLRNELYGLIHKDYAEFIRLSRHLKGVEKMVNEMKSAMLEMQRKIEMVRDQMTTHVTQIEASHQEYIEKQRKQDVDYSAEEAFRIYETMFSKEKEGILIGE